MRQDNVKPKGNIKRETNSLPFNKVPKQWYDEFVKCPYAIIAGSYLLGVGPDFHYTYEGLAKAIHCSKATALKAVNQLIEHGYFKCVNRTVTATSGQRCWYVISDFPMQATVDTTDFDSSNIELEAVDNLEDTHVEIQKPKKQANGQKPKKQALENRPIIKKVNIEIPYKDIVNTTTDLEIVDNTTAQRRKDFAIQQLKDNGVFKKAEQDRGLFVLSLVAQILGRRLGNGEIFNVITMFAFNAEDRYNEKLSKDNIDLSIYLRAIGD